MKGLREQPLFCILTCMLTDTQKERYGRHLMLDSVGAPGQERLLAGRVLIIGAGGLGSPAALYLAAAGVGSIGIADSDVVDLSNLQRQILHATADVGVAKTSSAVAKLAAINPDLKLNAHQLRVDSDNIAELLAGYDFVLDCTDNFDAKFLINDACVFAGKPYSHGGILKYSGQTMTVLPGTSACYRCIFPEPPDEITSLTCSRAGVLGVLPGVIGTIQATEAIKSLLGIGELLLDRLLTYDSLNMKFREIPLRRSPHCPVCSTLIA
jgi:molybdopterin/thiamine biosynthesis adenylyltransferase